ncbi:MAG: hypothetical protein JWM68_3763 [Verrucomicrobiales bacterium]|nr:hypothetical protein [Verrucomicrobiales bacterium]
MSSRKTTSVWMPLYIGDYLRDTMHLRREEHGSYLLLIMAYWNNQGPLSDDDEYLSGIARVELPEWTQTVRKRLAPFFVTEAGLWTHNRIEVEIARAKGTQTARKAAAKAGNDAKALKRLANGSQTEPPASANGNARGSQNPPHSPSPSQMQEREREPNPPERHFPEVERPDADEVKVYAGMIGLADWKALDWFDEMQGCGWLDFHRREIVDWKAVLRRVKVKWESDGRPTSPPGPRVSAPQGSSTGSPQGRPVLTRWIIQKDIDLINARIVEIKKERDYVKSPELKAECTEKIKKLRADEEKLKAEFDAAKE